MSISIKSHREIEIMREAGKILAFVHEELGKSLHPGMTTWEIDRIGRELIHSKGCDSVNDEVVHGIPSKKRIIKEGDIVSLDAGVYYNGYHSDAARTHAIGKVNDQAAKLIEVTRQSFFEGIKFAKEGYHLNDISRAIGEYAESFGFGVVLDLVGHGIGSELHEEPQVPNKAQEKRGPKLRAGMTLAIEPMINAGDYRVNWQEDKWTVTTLDGSLSAHYENTILITDGEPEILSLSQ